MSINEREILKNPMQTYKKLAIPLTFYAIFDALYLLIDTFWASFFGVEGLIAVGVATPIFALIVKFGATLGQGTNSYMSRSFGAYNNKQAENTFIHGILIGIIVAIIIPLISLPFLKEIMGLFNYHDSLAHITYYLVPLLVCAFIFILNELLSETIQSEGDSKRPTIFMITGNIINLITSPILAFKFEFGIFGISLGTIIGSTATLSLFLYIYIKQVNINTKISFKNFKFDIRIVKEIIKVTLPNFIDRSLFSIVSVYINLILSIFAGAEYIAVYAFCTNISDLIQSPSRGSARGLLTITGHLYGAKRINKIRKIYKFGLILGIVLSILTSILLIYSNNIILPYIDSSILEAVNIRSIILTLIIINLIVPISFTTSKILDGLGKSIYSLIGSIIKIGLDLILIGIFAFISKYEGYSVLYGILLSEIIVTIYYIILIQLIFNKIDTV